MIPGAVRTGTISVSAITPPLLPRTLSVSAITPPLLRQLLLQSLKSLSSVNHNDDDLVKFLHFDIDDDLGKTEKF